MGKVKIIIGMFLVVLLITFAGIYATRNIGKSGKTISKENAEKSLDRMVKRIGPATGNPSKSAVDYTEEENVAQELPDISTCPVTTEATTSRFAEIYSSPEKAGSGTDGWLCEMAEAFNREGVTVDGEPVSVRIRKVNSGQAIDYISSGKAVPDAITPSALFWADMLNARGIGTKTISDRMVGNTAGLVISKKKYDELKKEYGGIDIKAITEAVEEGKIAFGYTNPFASTAGMNYLISTLLRYDSQNPLSEAAVSGFQKFQQNIPLVSLTTMQMRTAAQKGTLDGFILEYQTYINDSNLKSNYQFIPYGFRHDNPLVMIEGSKNKAILEAFAKYCQSEKAQKKATQYGFNGNDNYKSDYTSVDGNTLLSAQQLYKENKDNGKEIIAVFVADVSGSMDGAPLNSLKDSLINSMKYIKPEHHIGLVSYNQDVTIELPIEQFDLNQQAYFKGAVEELSAGGATATYDAVIVASSMIRDAMKEHPDAKPMLFVLSDGETNEGYDFKDIRDVVDSLGYPIYTIGYNYSNGSLEELSEINEAASINAETEDIIYQLKQLFNASM